MGPELSIVLRTLAFNILVTQVVDLRERCILFGRTWNDFAVTLEAFQVRLVRVDGTLP